MAQQTMAQRHITGQFARLVNPISLVTETTGSELHCPIANPQFTDPPSGCLRPNRMVLKTSGTLGITAWFILSNSTPRQTSPTPLTYPVAMATRTLDPLLLTAPSLLGSKTISRMLTAERHHGSLLVATVLVRYASNLLEV
jgi:hypothetical protein